jgi:SAM-dependent methyltransferase
MENSPTNSEAAPKITLGRLGDTTGRDYSRKLQLFNAFAEPELRQAIASLQLTPGLRVLDAGCGGGDAIPWLSEATAPDGMVIGIDLATAHTRAACTSLPPGAAVLQADLLNPPVKETSLDLIWSVNTVNHFHNPADGVRRLSSLLRPGGRFALGQSSLLPEMFFAWDSRLERLTTMAVRRYYQERYGLSERDLAAVRSIVGTLRDAGLKNVAVRTFVVERISPLAPADETYLVEAIFRDTWGERLRPYLATEEYDELARLCDPADSCFALRRPDFHFLQTFTLAVGEA